MKHSTPDKAKFKKFQRRLGMSLKEAVGTLELLWRATVINAMDGAIGKLDNETIAIECDFDGDPDLLVKTLVDCGWLDECETHRLVVHDWKEHAPQFIKGNLERHGKGFAIASCLEQPAKQATTDESQAAIATCSEDTASKPNLTIPNLTIPNQTKPNQTKSSCPEPTKSSDAGHVGSGIVFPVKGKTKKTWELPQSKLDEWLETFDGVDVHSEVRKARQWCSDNSKSRKTASGMTRFLSNWLARVNDRSPPSDSGRNEWQRQQDEIRREREIRERREAAEQSRIEANLEAKRSATNGEAATIGGLTNHIVERDTRSDEECRHDLDQVLRDLG